MARSFTALACLALARACSPEDCGACSEAQCNATKGCRDESLYEAHYCLPLTGDRGHLDASPGRSAGAISSTLGLVGAFLACWMRCSSLDARARRRWTEDFLEEGNPAVLRAQATVQEKLEEKDCMDQTDSTYSLRLQFQAKEVFVYGRAEVLPEFWVQVRPGILPLEVAYPLQEPREFVVVENERMRLRTLHARSHWSVNSFIILVLLLGLGGLGVLASGCPLMNFGRVALMLLAGTVCGQFLWLPFSCRRYVARNQVQVERNQEQCCAA